MIIDLTVGVLGTESANVFRREGGVFLTLPINYFRNRSLYNNKEKK